MGRQITEVGVSRHGIRIELQRRFAAGGRFGRSSLLNQDSAEIVVCNRVVGFEPHRDVETLDHAIDAKAPEEQDSKTAEAEQESPVAES